MEYTQQQRCRQARNQDRSQRQQQTNLSQTEPNVVQPKPTDDTFAMIVELNHVTYQLIYLQPPMAHMQLNPISALGYSNQYYPTHDYYQMQWIWGQFQRPLTVQLHLWA